MNQEHIDLGYTARAPFERFHARTERFACVVAHRRAGKTVACIYDLVDAALRADNGQRNYYAFVAPLLKQAKTVAWDYLREAVFPLRNLGVQINESELRVDLFNGSRIRLFGADNPDALRGIGLSGVVLDEYADMDPRIGAVIGPALTDRSGFAVYIGTPRGHNLFWEIWQKAQGDPAWFSMMLKASETGITPAVELEIERRNRTESEYAQEYECDFEAAVAGAYYGALLKAADADGRVCGTPYDPAARVWTAWDLGFRDATAVWFAQVVGREVHIIDYYESTGTTIDDDVAAVQDKPYRYAGHIVPHDAYATSKQTGRTTAQIMEGLGLHDLRQAPDHRIQDGISNVQLMLPRCWFDKTKTAFGLECLKLYRADFDEKLKTFKQQPRHDYTSHAADAFRYLAMALDNVRNTNFHKRIEYPISKVA